MEKKAKVLVYLPRKLYIELHERQLTNHVSYLVSRLLEEFLKVTDARISWAEMPTKSEQREYLERKLKEFFSRTGMPTELPKPSFQEKAEPTYAEPPKPPVQGKAEPPRTSTQERMENYAEPRDDFSFSKEDRWWESLW